MGRNSSLPPGFRFHPTDVELVKYYLKRKVLGKKLHFQAIAEIEINKYAPWDLPNKSCLRTGDLKWYFFCPSEKKYARGVRKNRANEYGFWKATGKDRPVQYKNEDVGMIKTLVFHTGKPQKGCRTDWVMHEYRLEEKELAGKGIAQDGYVLCVLFKKDGPGPKNGAQYGAPFNEDEWDDDEVEEEMTVQLSILPAVMHAHAVMLPNNPNMSIATSSQVSGCTSTGPLISCPSQTPSTACKTLPRVSNDAVASIESLQAVHGGVNGGEADSSAGMSAPAFQQPCNPIESLQAVHGGVNGGEADSSAGMSAPAFQQPCNPSSSILASSCSYVPENTCSADIPSVSHGEAPQIVDDDDIFSHLELLDNDHTESADFGGIAEPDKYWSLGGLASLEGGGGSIPISQYFMDPHLPGSNADFLELMDLDTPLPQSRGK